MYRSEINDFDPIERTLSTPIIKKYRVFFAHSPVIDILLAFPHRDVVPTPNTYHLGIHTELCIDIFQGLKQFVTFLAIQKLTNTLFAEKIETEAFLGFDGIVYEAKQEILGAYLRQRLLDIASLPNQRNLSCDSDLYVDANLIQKRLRVMLANYHCFNIVLRRIRQNDIKLRERTLQPILRVAAFASIQQYDEGHQVWQDKPVSPYRRDQQQLFSAIKSLSKENNSGDIKDSFPQNEQMLRLGQVLNDLHLTYTLYKQNYQSFKKQYQKIYNVQFLILGMGKHWAEKIKAHYQLIYSRENVKLLMRQEIEQRKEAIHENCQGFVELQNIVRQYHNYFGSQPRKNISYTSIEELKRTEANYYAYICNSKQSATLFQPQLIEQYAALLKKQNKHGVILWHFLKAKVAGYNGKLYRALAHLKTAKKLTQQVQIVSTLLMEEGRFNQLLGHTQLALTCFKKCRCLREQTFGTLHPMILPPLYNLLLLYIKQSKVEDAKQIKAKIDCIRAIWSEQQLNQLIELRDFWIIEQQYQEWQGKTGPIKWQKIPNKEQLIKLQAVRMPIISKIYLTHSTIDQSSANLHLLYLYPNQFSASAGMYCLLKAVKSNLPVSTLQINKIVNNLPMLKQANIKNYHRLLFILNFYWQQQQNLQNSLQCMRNIMKTYMIVGYSSVVRYSLQKRYVYILKKSRNKKQLLSYYLHNDMGKREDLEELFVCVCICYQQKYYRKCIIFGSQYLKMIKLYPTQPQTQTYKFGKDWEQCQAPSKNKGKQKIIDHSFSIRKVIAKASIHLAQFQRALEMIQSLYESIVQKQNMKEAQEILIQLAEQGFKEEEYQIVLKGLDLLLEVSEQSTQQKIKQQAMILEYLPLETQQKVVELLIQTLCKLKIQDISVYVGYIQKIYVAKDQMQTIVAQQEMGHSSWKQLKRIVCKLNSKLLQELIEQPLSTQQFQQLIRKKAKQNQVTFNNLLSVINRFLRNHNHSEAINNLVNLITSSLSQWGKHSTFVVWLHLLLLKLTSEIDQKHLELQLLYWLSPYKKDLDIQSGESDFWTTKQGRDLRLDQLLYLYLQSMSVWLSDVPSKNTLSSLWWHTTVKNELSNLKIRYLRIINADFEGDTLSGNILNFKIKYSSLFISDLSESDTLARISQIYNSIQNQNEEP